MLFHPKLTTCRYIAQHWPDVTWLRFSELYGRFTHGGQA